MSLDISLVELSPEPLRKHSLPTDLSSKINEDFRCLLQIEDLISMIGVQPR